MQPQDPNQPNSVLPQPQPQTPINPTFQQEQQPVVSTPQPQAYPSAVPPQNAYPTPTKGSSSKKLLIIGGILIAVLIIGGGIFAMTKGGSKDKSGSSLIGQDKTEKKDGAIGDTLSANGLEVGITNLDQKAQLDKYTVADKGKTFMIASVTIKNGTTEEMKVYPGDFKLSTSDKRVVDGKDYYGSSNNLPEDAIAPGGDAKGVVVFEVDPKVAESINFKYKQFPEDVSKDTYTYDFTYKIN